MKRQPFFNKEGQGSFFSKSNVVTSSFFSPSTIQPKLTIGQPNDKYELEADAMADKVVQRLSQPSSEVSTSKDEKEDIIQTKPLDAAEIQTKCDECEHEEKLQKKEEDEVSETDLEVQEKSIFESNGEQPEAEVQAKPMQPIDAQTDIGLTTTEIAVNGSDTVKAKSMLSNSPVTIASKIAEPQEQLQENEEEFFEAKEEIHTKLSTADIPQPPDGEENIQTKSVGAQSEASSDLQRRLNSSKGGGSQLSSDMQSSMGNEFGTDFSNVKVHTDSGAVQMSQDLGAQAFTHGNDIYFNESKYDTNSDSGKHLLAHELTHTIQQGGIDSYQFIQRSIDDVITQLQRRVIGREEVHERRSALLREIDSLTAEETIAVYRRIMAGSSSRPVGERNSARDTDPLTGSFWRQLSGPLRELILERIISDLLMNNPALLREVREVEGLIEMFVTEDQETYVSIQGASLFPIYTRDWIRGPGEPHLLSEINRRMDIKVLNRRGNHLDWFLRYLGRINGSDARKITIETLIETRRVLLQTICQAFALGIISYIKSVARLRSQQLQSIDTSSHFFQRLRDFYLTEYLQSPSLSTGREAVQNRIGRQMVGRESSGNVFITPPGEPERPALGYWEEGAILYWNEEELPLSQSIITLLTLRYPSFGNLTNLPRQLGAATDILRDENIDELPFIDAPFLVGRPNPNRNSLRADVEGGGANISQLMHWATGVRRAEVNPNAMRELFLAYEVWHEEGWSVFGTDAINDLIGEEQGRLLGRELMLGDSGSITDEASLEVFINSSFRQSRAWVGQLIERRITELDALVLNETIPQYDNHWEGDLLDAWQNQQSIRQMLWRGDTIEEINESTLVNGFIEIYRLVYESQEWESQHGEVQLTSLQMELANGQYNELFRYLNNTDHEQIEIERLHELISPQDGSSGVSGTGSNNELVTPQGGSSSNSDSSS